MLNIAICDDDKNDLERIKGYIKQYKDNNKDIDIRIFAFKDGNDLLVSEQKYDIIFLDIEMEHSNGIAVGQKIRQSDMNVHIVYVTEYTINWRKAYKGAVARP